MWAPWRGSRKTRLRALWGPSAFFSSCSSSLAGGLPASNRRATPLLAVDVHRSGAGNHGVTESRRPPVRLLGQVDRDSSDGLRVPRTTRPALRQKYDPRKSDSGQPGLYRTYSEVFGPRGVGAGDESRTRDL